MFTKLLSAVALVLSLLFFFGCVDTDSKSTSEPATEILMLNAHVHDGTVTGLVNGVETTLEATVVDPDVDSAAFGEVSTNDICFLCICSGAPLKCTCRPTVCPIAA